jgi:cation diffusion facilitator CzcD-associated flavoprotein CzcO
MAAVPPATAPDAPVERVDVLIVGAGLSGIGVAHHLQERHPSKRYVILEARAAIGGTWDVFRYPGIRSDSSMHTYGYGFRPWREERSIADASSILRYIRETAAEAGIDRHVRYGQRVVGAAWSSDEQEWVVAVEDGSGAPARRIAARWLVSAAGYFRHDQGYTPPLEGAGRFAGPIVHPQRWPEDLDYAGKRVVVIGSGATAITLVPAMAATAAHVTMVQRTPTYVVSAPAVDPSMTLLARWLGAARAQRAVRAKDMWLEHAMYRISRRYPRRMRSLIRALNVKALPDGFDVDRHFVPPYNPWDQRMCIAPDGDFFHAIGEGRASVITGRVRSLTERGVALESGAEIAADVVVTATGLAMEPFGGLALTVDERPVAWPDTYLYKSMMLTDVPNFAFVFGYTNASWTLRVDIVAEHLCRMLALMDEHGYGACVPDAPPPGSVARPMFEHMTSGYLKRVLERFPRQGPGHPWELSMDYIRDRVALTTGPVGDHARFHIGSK